MPRVLLLLRRRLVFALHALHLEPVIRITMASAYTCPAWSVVWVMAFAKQSTVTRSSE